MRHFDEAGGERTVLILALRLAAGRQRRDRGAVVIAVAVQNLVLLAVVFERGQLAHQLEAFFVGLGTRVGVIHARQAGHLVDQLFGELGARDIARGVGEITHLGDLIAHRVGDAFAAVADVDRPHAAGNRVEIFLAVVVPDAHALALDDDHRVGVLPGFVLHQVVPKMISVAADDFVDVFGFHRR